MRIYSPAFVQCPACSGVGKTPYQTKYGSIDCLCLNCSGRGMVRAGTTDETCVHVYSQGRNVGKCLTEHVCAKCGDVRLVDSSD